MNHHPVHHHGEEIPITFIAGMYRADFGGEHFCSQTREGVIYALGRHHSVAVVVPKEVLKPKEPHEVVRYSIGFTEKQEHLPHMIRRANDGCGHSRKLVEKMAENKNNELAAAEAIAAEFCRNDRLSRITGSQIVAEANRVTAKLNKSDLAHVTHLELTQHVSDVVLRNGVMRLLVERFSF